MEGRSIERAGQAVDNAVESSLPLEQLDPLSLIAEVQAELTLLRDAAEEALLELAKLQASP
jgi:hypothetical protein